MRDAATQPLPAPALCSCWWTWYVYHGYQLECAVRWLPKKRWKRVGVGVGEGGGRREEEVGRGEGGTPSSWLSLHSQNPRMRACNITTHMQPGGCGRRHTLYSVTTVNCRRRMSVIVAFARVYSVDLFPLPHTWRVSEVRLTVGNLPCVALFFALHTQQHRYIANTNDQCITHLSTISSIHGVGINCGIVAQQHKWWPTISTEYSCNTISAQSQRCELKREKQLQQQY